MPTLTLHNNSNGNHWFPFHAYTQNEIEAIKDPQGGQGEQPTSIPSPFAQMDLVRTAFKTIAILANLQENISKIDKLAEVLDGNTNNHRLISNALDIGELFYYQKRIRNVDFICWNKKGEIARLKDSASPGQKLLADALELYLEQDKETFNFANMENLYFVRYEKDPDVIVGGTSPQTLFFASPNKQTLDRVQEKLSHPSKFFHDQPYPLYRRSEEYVYFLYSLKAAMPNFASIFKEFDEYLTITKVVLQTQNPGLNANLNRIDRDSYFSGFEGKYATEELKDTNGTNIEILGLPLRGETGAQEVNSDFLIAAGRVLTTNAPLVLSKKHGGTTGRGRVMKYVNGRIYDKAVKDSIPFYDGEMDLQKRTLPGGVGINYPYLVESDFLEEYLVKLPYELNSQRFKSFVTDKLEDKYLLPIKKRFFDFFTVADLDNDMLSMKETGDNNVEVKLKIPLLNGECVEFTRIYFKKSYPDPENNKGTIILGKINLAISPFIKFVDITPYYRVHFSDIEIAEQKLKGEYTLYFYNKMNETIKTIVKQKFKKTSACITSVMHYVIEENEFDYINLKNDSISAVIIPNYTATTTGAAKYNIAIDFGTTNTHVELASDRNFVSQPLTYQESDLVIGTLHKPQSTTIDIDGKILKQLERVIHDFMPLELGGASQYSFPTRTVIAEKRGMTYNEVTYGCAEVSIPFAYEKLFDAESETIPNLKWANYVGDTIEASKTRERIRAFFENLLFILRTKILMNNGDLSSTKMIWFYPSSMMETRRDSLEQIWRLVFGKYFNRETNSVIGLSESVAPFYFYLAQNRISASEKPVLSIDIGGATTDTVIFKKNIPTILTSFKYAGDALWGSGFSEDETPETNGFCLKYDNNIKTKLQDFDNLINVFNQLTAPKEKISFYFSLINNRSLAEKHIKIDFMEDLKSDGEMKAVLLVFLISILYHVAKLMKAEEIEMPRYVCFSGTGSKFLSILTPNDERLVELTKTVFENIYDEVYGREGLHVIREPNPKEITCKGGIRRIERPVDVNVEDIKRIYLGSATYSVDNAQLTYADEAGLQKAVSETTDAIKEFVSFLIKLNKTYSYNKKLGVTTDLNRIENILNDRITENILTGLEKKTQEYGSKSNQQNVEETFFFYHLIAALNRLGRELAQ